MAASAMLEESTSKNLRKRGTRVAASEAVCSERHIASWNPGANEIWDGPHIVACGNDWTGC